MAASDLLLVTNQVLFVDENTQLMKYNFNPLPGKAWSGMQESYKPGSALSSKNGRELPLSHDLFVRKKKNSIQSLSLAGPSFLWVLPHLVAS